MSSPSKVTQTNKTELSPEQKQLIQQGLSLTTPVANNVPHLPSVPDFNENQTAAQQGILDKAASGGALDTTTNNLGNAQNFLLGDVLDVNKNPALQGAVSAALHPLQDQFQQVVLPGLNHAATGTGAFSSFGTSKADQNKTLAGGQYMRQVGDTSSKIISDAYAQGLDAMTKGVALAPQTQKSLLFPEAAQGAVGDTQAALKAQQSQQGFEDSLFPFNLGLQLLGSAGAVPGGGTSGTVTGAQPNSPITQLLGSALSAIAFL